jgi:NAD(P)-dependent dehydrogenase (short-subunit alcohol dehydrogenase family)
VAIVTGGAAGIGKATARRLAAGGASVVVADVSGVEEAVAELSAAGLDVRGRRADVSSAADMEAVARFTRDAYGPAGVLACCAGIQRYGTVVDTPEDEWDRVMAVNLKGMYLAARFAVPQMRELGGGAIVNVASVQAFGAQRAVGGGRGQQGRRRGAHAGDGGGPRGRGHPGERGLPRLGGHADAARGRGPLARFPDGGRPGRRVGPGAPARPGRDSRGGR